MPRPQPEDLLDDPIPRAPRRPARPARIWGRVPPPLSTALILSWADHEQRRTGRWPRCTGGSVLANRNETWRNLDALLRAGGRTLPGGDSLPRLLARERGVRNQGDLPRLTEARIKRWARAHKKAQGRWPYHLSGPIPQAPGESWASVERALREGSRGLPGGDTLARFVARHFGARNKAGTPRLSEAEVLAWADAFHAREGRWPKLTSGTVVEAPAETWERLDICLREGLRGLPPGSSLARLLAAQRGARNQSASPPLTQAQVLAWAAAHKERTGRWPTQTSGPVSGAPGETWGAIQRSLYVGQRGLPGGDSIVRLVRREGAAGASPL